MPIAAVPSYLGKDFAHASPGMRFGMYLALWGINRRTKELLWTTHDIDYKVRGENKQERPVPYENKVTALKDSKKLSNYDKRVMEALAVRQRHAFGASAVAAASVQIDGTATAPFATGLGNEHPLENGFAFLNPYGLPYLPGSGVKGVARQAARELASGEWSESFGWSEEKRYTLKVGKETVVLSMPDVLFGLESEVGNTVHVRGVLSFWDVLPQIDGDSLMVEIMTPHQGHYYQDGKSPHESGQPNPISFLTIPPGSGFTFYVTCNLVRLNKIAADLCVDELWKELLKSAFNHAFDWLGFGAKTAVGYGAMQPDLKATNERLAGQRQLEQRNVREQELQTATAGLPEDAAWIVQKRMGNAWPDNDNSAFLADAEAYLPGLETLSPEGYAKFTGEMERRWRGVMANPDAVEGKKQKPKFKDRPRKLAKRLLELKAAKT